MNDDDTAEDAPALNDASRLLDTAGRIMLTHAIDPACAMRALDISRGDAEAMIHLGRIPQASGHWLHERLLLFVNALARLEWRLRHDRAGIRLALQAPLGALDGSTIAETFGGTLGDLRRLRRAIDTLELPKAKWFRVCH